MRQPPKEDSFHHSVLGCRDAKYSSELMEIGGPTYTLYVDVREDRWTSLFLSTVRELQEALEDVYTNGSSTSIVDISIPIASFRPRSLEALNGHTKILDREIRVYPGATDLPRHHVILQPVRVQHHGGCGDRAYGGKGED